MGKKKLVEAMLFATHEGFTIEDIAKRLKVNEESALNLVKELQKEVETREGGLEVVHENNRWRMRIKFGLLSVVKDLMPTEMPVSVIKTLAVIAWKCPIKQSKVIHIRGNKAYDHIRRLKEKEFITSKPSGRTNILNLGRKFYDYFDITRKDLKKTIDVEEKKVDIKQEEIEIEMAK